MLKTIYSKTTVTRFCGDDCAKRAYKKRKRTTKVKESYDQTTQLINEKWHQANNKEYLTVQETCVYIGISRSTLWRITRLCRIEPKMIGSRLIYSKKKIERFMNEY
ncbi:helix-turn-helix domain-containing protein [Algoriphagus sp. D3-2-R+10]|uniref:helix-turn-helix domain-containing protein n=1 Tax=Algoriphagus aurantiacus TaxID=3103948 RepID=UPI002B3C8B8A|nr:helix-turn-helix domain-containing protein [Algoriphagus sp. D3-2-R+10]MEB2774278.1 helix-turn-helix domain-containing protein [Algoriphagus sp. D3-2-R+10]